MTIALFLSGDLHKMQATGATATSSLYDPKSIKEVQQDQLEVQRRVQMRIEAQGKYLQSVLEKAQTNLTLETGSNPKASLEKARAHRTYSSNNEDHHRIREDTSADDRQGRISTKDFRSGFENQNGGMQEDEKQDLKPVVNNSDLVQLELSMRGSGYDLFDTGRRGTVTKRSSIVPFNG